ncbi:MAG TPA: Rrf2 family transcriptional regulator [Acidimicrobiales bacterium]|nr:Rrf2 family transcriptional regulator [Acidimicrobiales bacterium]
MTLSKRGDYVVRSALCLARAYDSGEHRKLREVVAEMAVPQTFASQILADLVRAGLASSRAGRDGGYRLVRPPDAISLVEVVEAGEGPLHAERCALGDGPCRWEAVCPLHETWRSATGALRDVLAATTLASLADADRAIEAGRTPAPADSHRQSAVSIAVADSVHVEHGIETVARHLSRKSWVAARVADAYASADELRRSVDAAGLPWVGSRRPAVHTERLASADTAESQVVLEWELALTRGAESRLEATVELRELDPERTELLLVGRFRPPSAAGGTGAPSAFATQLAKSTIRAFVRSVAASIETESATRRAARAPGAERVRRSTPGPATGA